MKRTLMAWLLACGLVLSGIGVNLIPKSPAIAAAENTQNTIILPDTAATGPAITEPTAEPTIAPTIDAPMSPIISMVKGGNKRIKIYWGKISNASGYKIYYSTSKTGTYTLLKTITDTTTVKYVKTGLKQNTTYYIKMTAYNSADNIISESTYSNVVSAKTSTVAATSTAAKTYAGKAKFKASPAYKKFPALSKYSTYKKSFAIPGMKNTNVAGFASTKMIPQGMCQAGGYYLISAYDYYGVDESVIYILNRASHSYITTLVLPNKDSVDALAYDGTNIWISKGSYVAYFPYTAITSAVNSGATYSSLSNYTGYMKINTKPQVLAFHDGILWGAANNTTASSYMYGYEITNNNGTCSLTQKYYMKIPSKVQGITFDSDGYMYMTRSYRKSSSLSGYISQIRTYKPNLSSPSKKGLITKGSILVKRKLPPLAQGVAAYGKYVYTLYSGCQYAKCVYKVDRVIATKKTALHP